MVEARSASEATKRVQDFGWKAWTEETTWKTVVKMEG
jgi:hypothetical protein